MIRSIYFDTEGTPHHDLPVEAIERVIADRLGTLWVDLPSVDADSISILRDVFHFHELAIDDCSDGHVDTPKVDDYESYLFIVAHSIHADGQTELVDIRECDFFLGPNYVVTSREKEISTIDALFGRCTLNTHLLSQGADFLAHTVLDEMVDLILPAVEELDEQLASLEQTILDRPERSQLLDVLRLKRNVQRLRRSILPERDLVNRLSRGEFALIRREALIFYRDIYDHIVRVEEMLDGLRDLADSALGSYLSAVNNRMNEIMKTLSVVTAIFLPLTLIASIYGTNLDFTPWNTPELPGGFLFMLTGMVALTVALVAYFRSRHWF